MTKNTSIKTSNETSSIDGISCTSNEKTQGVGYKYGRFRGSVGMGILWEFPQDFLWEWDGYGN